MRPIRIAHLGVAFLLLASGMLLAFWLYQRVELGRIEQALRQNEEIAARRELEDGMAEVEKMLARVAANLSEWDETRQQLYNDEYYTLWRDNRTRDAGFLPDAVQAVSLYNTRGEILRPNIIAEPMPLRLPLPAPPYLYYQQTGAQHNLYYFVPVHADPEHTIQLGYVGIKIDLLHTLAELDNYRFLDIDRLQLRLTSGARVILKDTVRNGAVPVRNNRSIDQLVATFEETQLRMILVMASLLGLAALGVNFLLVRPLRALTRELDKLSSDPTPLTGGHLGNPAHLAEIETLRHSFHEYQEQIGTLHRNLQESSRDFHDQARRDALTGVYNRRGFDEDWRALEADKRVRSTALIQFDCDHFKAINDTYGHPTGDAVIQAIANCLVGALRSDDRLYRLGGDEFATLMTNADLEMALQVAERCLEHVLSYDFQRLGIVEPVTISIGIARMEGALNLPTLHKQADLAMYEAKRPGNRKIIVYEPSIGHLSSLLENREVSAVYLATQHADMLEFRYQPIVRLPGETLDYVEALVRIRLDGRVIGAGPILAIVHERRLDVEFDLAVIAAIRHDVTSAHPALSRGVSINISAAGLISTKVVDALLAMRRAIDDRKLLLEITETALISHMDIATQHLQLLREAGWLIALDDFGSGYSSLRYLASMPVDMVKFDMSLVRLLDQPDIRQQALVRDIAELVSAAGYDLVAEGIESESLLSRVGTLGFSHAQGFHVDRLLGHVRNLPEAQSAPGLNP